MAIVSFPLKEMEALIGRKLSKEDLEERIPMIGVTFEGVENGNVRFDIFPDRIDMFSIENFAREIRKFFGIEKGLTRFKVLKSKVSFIIDESVRHVRPFLGSALIKNVKLTNEQIALLMQLQEKLHETLGRKRRKVAIGLHDASKVEPPFIYKAVDPKSVKFVPLDKNEEMDLEEILERHEKGVAYSWILKSTEKYPIIVDAKNNVLSFPPIINAELTRVTEKTREILLDVTGTDAKAVEQVVNIVCSSFAERGCKIYSVLINDKYVPTMKPRKMRLHLNYVNKLLGLNLNEKKVNSLLKRMGMEYKNGYALIPCYRYDVMHPIDLVEDIAIAYGYDRFKPRISASLTIAKRSEEEEFVVHVRELMIAMQLQEVVTMLLTNKEQLFDKMRRKEKVVAETLNPASKEFSVLRDMLLPSLLKVLYENKHNEYPQKIFEIGKIIDEKLNEKTHLAICITYDEANYNDVASVIDALFNALKLNYKLIETNHESFIEGRVANISLNNTSIGIVGEVHPKVLENFKLEKPVVACEIDLTEIRKLLKNSS